MTTMTTTPAMRIKSRWFRPGSAGAEQQASAVAFIVWRVAQQVLKRMRGADFDIDTGPLYFAFMREVLVFLVALADRIAHGRLDAEARERFTVALVRHVARHLQDNEADLLGPVRDGEASYADRFVDLVNEVVPHYAEFEADPHAADDGAGFKPGFAFLRYLGVRLEPTLPAKDRRWVLDQVMEIEAPEAVRVVRQAMRELHDPSPRRARRSTLSGD